MVQVQVSLPAEAYSWSSQVVQYADAAPPEVLPGHSTYEGVVPGWPPVHCLLWWDWTSGGRPMIVGILNYYDFDSPWEQAGNVNVWVRPSRQRLGIGSRLVRLAETMYGPLNLDQQRYTESGAALVNALLRGEV